MNITKSIIIRDIKLALVQNGEIINQISFYFIVNILFAFTIGTDSENLKLFGPSVIWVCGLLVQTISILRIWSDDYFDGTLEQIILQGALLEKVVVARMVSHWLTTGLMLIVFVPAVAVLYGLDAKLLIYLIISLFCGTPILSVITVAISAMVIKAKSAGILFSILAFPLYIPILIFSTSWIYNYELFVDNMLLVLAFSAIILPASILASVFAIKISLEDN